MEKPLDARNGIVGATTSVSILYGDTGATAPSHLATYNASGTLSGIGDNSIGFGIPLPHQCLAQ